MAKHALFSLVIKFVICGFHVGWSDDSTFRGNILPPSSGWRWGSGGYLVPTQVTMKMEAARPSETSKSADGPVQCNKPQDYHLINTCCECLKALWLLFTVSYNSSYHFCRVIGDFLLYSLVIYWAAGSICQNKWKSPSQKHYLFFN
jgi:hypothetical protein